jgi:Bacterial regulatory proteins, tetR family
MTTRTATLNPRGPADKAVTSAPAKESLRDAHKDLTRKRILEAAIDCLNDEDLEQLTIEGVAAKAGVTKRTIYRHFSTREEMLTACWPMMQKMVGLPGTGNFEDTVAGLTAMPMKLFPNFDKQPGIVRASAYSRAGRELRISVNDRRKASFLKAAREARPDLGDAEALRLAATIQLLCSAFAWSVMRDFWGLSGEESGRAVSDAMKLLLDPDQKPAGQRSPESIPTRRASPTKKTAKSR